MNHPHRHSSTKRSAELPATNPGRPLNRMKKRDKRGSKRSKRG